jgi:flavin-dependent dehydrogenase
VVRWLGQQAESLGVEVFPGFAASEVMANVAFETACSQEQAHRKGTLGVDRRSLRAGTLSRH